MGYLTANESSMIQHDRRGVETGLTIPVGGGDDAEMIDEGLMQPLTC